MLVLSRKEGEKIVIGDGEDSIVLTILEFRRLGEIRIGIEAPKHMVIRRSEVSLQDLERRYCDACHKEVDSYKFHESNGQALCHRHFERKKRCE